MPLIDEVRHEQIIAELSELAVGRLAAELHVPIAEAAKMLFVSVGQTMTLGAVGDAVRTIHQTRRGTPHIG